MTIVSDLITRSYRETNLIAIGVTPSTAEQTEGLSLLNSLVQSTIGLEAGQELRDFNIGGTYDQSGVASYYVPENARLVCNLASAKTLKLDPHPYEGQRIAVVDVLGNFATRNLILDGNGRTIELDATETLSTNNFYAQWMYRGDTADWTRITDLIASDEFPLPIEFDDYFIISLALRLNPRHGRNIAPESMAALARTKNLIQARYRKPRRPNEPVWGLLGQRRYFGSSKAAFDAGIA